MPKPRYLTVVLRLADNAENKLVFDQVDRIKGATLSAAAWSHLMDEANTYREALEYTRDYSNDPGVVARAKEALKAW